MTLESLSERAGCTKGYLSSIETGRRDRPPSEGLLERIESALGMEAGTLVRRGWWASTPTEIRRTVIGLERRTRAAARLAALVLREARAGGAWSAEVCELAERVSGAGVAGAPVINDVAGGYPVDFLDEGFPWRAARGYVSAPEGVDDGAFAVRVVGGEMRPAYEEGDVVIVSPGEGAASGSDCFVRLRGGRETTFRRVYFEELEGRGVVRLQPLDSSRRPEVVWAEEVSGLATAVYVLRRAPGVCEERGEGVAAGAAGAR